jgi:spore germination protein GerM
MEDQPKNRAISPKLIVTVAAVVLAAGAATAWWASNSLNSSRQGETKPIPSETNLGTPRETEKPPQEETVEVYWLDDNLELVATSVRIQKANGKENSLEKAMELLLAGPAEPANGTTIPEGTKLLSFNLAKDGIHLNFSKEFTSGGGSASMTGRLGQIIYTATSLEPNAKVWISIEGEPLEELGGEGLLVEQPMTRQLFEEYFGF